MLQLQKILFPTDFSRCADQALAHAVFLAEKYDAEIHVLHVVTLFKDQPGIISNEITETEETIRKLEDIAEKQLNKVVDLKGSDDMKIIAATKREVSAAPAILEYASDNNIDLIVMGTHGRRGLGHLLLGSAAEEVVRLAVCPVFTIRELKEPKPVMQVNNILVPVDFSNYSKSALAYASKIAQSYKAQLQVLHIIEETMHPAFSLSGKSSIFDLVPGIKDDSRKRAEKMLKEVVSDDIKSNVYVKGGRAASDIINFAKENSTDLIVIATHGLTGLEHMLLGSVTEKVVRMAHCPVFTVKAFGKSLLK
ncbi:MAG: universal stress protein [Ignavibacteriaceae bacterium]|jgi:nucleotide-binding universal stress UspA family protein|nr:universal stress protein [Ignavibacteriaceae bacterium]MCW8812783.1 universal stress protein [Chlorobium sp.]MCW8824466.1 universal stress protein [Ignavibacteriaceae bacterium]